jgi:intracellular septation protein A
MESYFFELTVSAAILLADVIILFAYVIGSKKIPATILYVFGGAFAIYGISTLIAFDDSFVLMVPGFVFILFGVLSLIVPLILKPRQL